MELIVDDREKALFDYLENISHKTRINYKIQRCSIGDYSISYKGYILLVIERKTWVDLSASMRDGRKHNVEKLFKLRTDTGCQIAYLIEGNATPKFDAVYGNLPIRNLRAHLDHLAFRDNIQILYSASAEYTAGRLFELAQNLLSCKKIIQDIDEKEAVNGAYDASSKLKEKQVSNIGLNEQLLRCLPGIGSIISATLSEQGITLYQLYKSEYTTEQIAELKYSTGAMIGMDKGRKIAEQTRKVIISASELGVKTRRKILMTIPLISKATADRLMEQTTLRAILDETISVEELADLKKTDKMRLGIAAANNIVKNLISLGKKDEESEDKNPIDEPNEEDQAITSDTEVDLNIDSKVDLDLDVMNEVVDRKPADVKSIVRETAARRIKKPSHIMVRKPRKTT